jgi:hypothetical protein
VNIWHLFLHLFHFLAPALGVAALLCLALAVGGRVRGARCWRAWCWLALAGAMVLVAGLLHFGRDGQMATYLLMVGVMGSVAWWLDRGPAGRR